MIDSRLNISCGSNATVRAASDAGRDAEAGQGGVASKMRRKVPGPPYRALSHSVAASSVVSSGLMLANLSGPILTHPGSAG